MCLLCHTANESQSVLYSCVLSDSGVPTVPVSPADTRPQISTVPHEVQTLSSQGGADRAQRCGKRCCVASVSQLCKHQASDARGRILHKCKAKRRYQQRERPWNVAFRRSRAQRCHGALRQGAPHVQPNRPRSRTRNLDAGRGLPIKFTQSLCRPFDSTAHSRHHEHSGIAMGSSSVGGVAALLG